MKVFVFLGPTLNERGAKKYLRATFLAPAGQGDVLRVLEEQPDVIGVIDGAFQFAPAVWHKEILTALEAGVRVYGAASMGALRAAELAAFGMIGVGKVFKMYASGACDDDDEVAVTYAASKAAGYAATSEAMVDIRDLCRAAVRRRVLDEASETGIAAAAKSLYFPLRTWDRIDSEAVSLGVDPATLTRLRAFRASYGPTLKQRDAIQMLTRIARSGHRRRVPRPDLRVQQTIFLVRLREEVARGIVSDADAPAGGVVDVARKKVLLALLASKEARRTGLDPSEDDIDRLTAWFRDRYGLSDDRVFDAWLAGHDLGNGPFERGMQRFAAVLKMEAASRGQLERETEEYIRLYGAATAHSENEPQWVQVNLALNRRDRNAQTNARLFFGALLGAVARLERANRLRTFHFVRKPPDIRLRFQAVRPGERLMPLLDPLLRDVRRRRWIDTVTTSIYEPEWRQFGGVRAMAAVHDYFHADSVNWIRWDQMARARQRRDAEVLTGAILNDLFLETVGCSSEVCDIWHNLSVLTGTTGDATNLPFADAPTLRSLANGALPAERAVLSGYRTANRRLAAALQRIRDDGDLTVGLRAVMPFVGMFHCNRFGINGAGQFSLASVMMNVWSPKRGFRA